MCLNPLIKAILKIGDFMKTNLSKRLGLRIKELRNSKNLKQCEMADLLDMERSNLTRIESGKQRPSDENLEKIAKILNIELYELFDNEHLKDKKELVDSLKNLIETLDEKELRYLYKTIQNLKQLR